ncbi:MAG: hypothetical protein JW833_06080 [Prolixibacteraceae bacterium]|nr:hypothetical protein [Prolixibacteraceae bacterium]
MKTDLEKYLKEKRLLLDADQPDENSVWEGIRAGLAEPGKVHANWFWKIAAVFLFGVLITYVAMNELRRGESQPASLADISEELGKQEAEFKKVANSKWDQVKPYLSEDKSDIRFLLDELNELETIHKIYQSDLKELGSNEYIIRALLDYYQKKIKILDRILLEIEKQNNYEEKVTL